MLGLNCRLGQLYALLTLFLCVIVFWTDKSSGTPGLRAVRPSFNALPRLSGFVLRLLQKGIRPPSLNITAPECTFPTPECDATARYRTADGYCNNLRNPAWGTPGWPFKRILPAFYDDGVNSPRITTLTGAALPSPRKISTRIHTHDSASTKVTHLTSLFTEFGQFLDHDIDLTPKASSDSELDCCEESIQFPSRGLYVLPPSTSTSFMFKRRPLPDTCFSINIDQPDDVFKSNCMNFVRSKVFSPTFKCRSVAREQGNAITSFIDASQVYGSSQTVQMSLRELVGGRLKGSHNNLLPANYSTTCKSSGITGKYCFGAGDVRVNEQPMLSSLHVVFHRYHNHIADTLSTINPHWDDETLFQESRKIVGAVMQHIVYNEYLPYLLGHTYMLAYNLAPGFFHWYEPWTDPRIINSFATAAFRFGHSMVSGHLNFGNSQQPLETAFFCPHNIQDSENVALDNLLKGTMNELSQKADRYFAPALSDKLFRDEEKGRSLDLVSLNIQRGRDHGLPPYNDFREACGLRRLDGTQPGEDLYLNVYGNMDEVDLFSGGLSEEPVPGGVVGETFACIIARQFRDLKYGDRFWYERLDPHTGFTRAQLGSIKRVTLASIICSVTGITNVQRRVFAPVTFGNAEFACDQIDQLDLSQWTTEKPSLSKI